MSVTVEDFDKCCRLCLTQIGRMAPLFGACLIPMLKSIVDLDFSDGDEYPQLVCARCANKVSATHNFRNMIFQSHETLTQALLKAGSIPHEPILLLEPQQEINNCNIITQPSRAVSKVEHKINPVSNLKKKILEKTIIKENVSVVNKDKEIILNDVKDHMNEIQKNAKKDNSVLETVSHYTHNKEEAVSDCQTQTMEQSNVEAWRNSSYEDDTMSISGSMMTVGESVLKDTSYNECTKEFPKKCFHCPEEYNNVADWKKHMQFLSSKSSCTVESEKCKNVVDEEDYNLHECLKEVDKKNLCKLCGYISSDLAGAIKHMKSHTKAALLAKGRKQTLCPYCGKCFQWRTSLYRHMRYHTGRLHQCRICSKPFSTKSYLRTHEASHNAIGKFECSTCQSRFTQKSSLNHHVLTIHRGKPRVKRKETISKHVKKHHGRPYQCHFCEKSFALETGRRTHERIHIKQQTVIEDVIPGNQTLDHDYEPKVRKVLVEFMCFNCELRFDQKEKLQEHMKTCMPTTKPVDTTVMKCKMCTDEFTECDVLLDHYNNVHELLAIIDENNGKKNITLFAEQLQQDKLSPDPKKKLYIRTKGDYIVRE